MATKTAATKIAAKTVAPKSKTMRDVQLPAKMGILFDELEELTVKVKELESRQKELKATIMSEMPEDQASNEVLIVRVRNKIRGKIDKRVRKGIDNKLLKEAFPEAYSVCETETEYRVMSF